MYPVDEIVNLYFLTYDDIWNKTFVCVICCVLYKYSANRIYEISDCFRYLITRMHYV